MNQNIKYIIEGLLDDFYDDEQPDIIGDFLRQGYKYFPVNKDELIEIIKQHLKNNNFNLNDIDVSKITDFSHLFHKNYFYDIHDLVDISKWDVSNGVDFSFMFYNYINFNGDLNLSEWNVHSGIDFGFMFYNCREFNCDLSNWDVSNGKNFCHMFNNCRVFNSNLSKWNVKNGEFFDCMFYGCYEFKSNLKKWNVKNGKSFMYMFKNCKKFNTQKIKTLMSYWQNNKINLNVIR